MGHTALSSSTLFRYAFVCGLVAAGAASVFLCSHAAADQLHAWKLLPRPERLSELYFTHHTRLPATFKSGKPQQLDFTVHNLEHRTTTYRYRIFAQTPDIKEVLGEGTVTLKHDESRDITRTVVMSLPEPRVEVRVNLAYDGIPFGRDTARSQTQNIYYWTSSAP